MVEKMSAFHLPEVLNATMPPEERGIRRDHVRMMVLDKKSGDVSHKRFFQLVHELRSGDLLVLNASRTIPAVLYGDWSREGSLLGENVEVRLASRLDEQTWDVLVVGAYANPGDRFEFTPSLSAIVGDITSEPFIRVVFSMRGSLLMDQIYAYGEPIRYEYISHPWELDYYQTVYASAPGSVEMPSAGRAFSWELLFNLRRRGVRIAYVQLHTGLSYLLEDSGHPDPRNNFEQYDVPPDTAEAIRLTKQAGGRVVAVGTTVVRALESAVDLEGGIVARSGWTNIFIDRSVPLRIADGLITGFHEPEASHLELLSAFIDPDLLDVAYRIAIAEGYLWHEFGDMNLII